MKYPFTVYRTEVDGHTFWIAESSALDGCVGQGETADEALSALAENEEVWLDTAEEFDIRIPDVPIEKVTVCSGKFTVRVSPYVHQCAAKIAQKQGVSLNQYVGDAIVSKNSEISTVDYISTELTQFAAIVKRFFSQGSTQSLGITHQSKVYKPEIGSRRTKEYYVQ